VGDAATSRLKELDSKRVYSIRLTSPLLQIFVRKVTIKAPPRTEYDIYGAPVASKGSGAGKVRLAKSNHSK
jgi:hypothetical protein